jgi:hypothetical protein
MVSEFLIASLVLVLGVYWFRYNCQSILKINISVDRARKVAAANQLGFPEVSARLQSETSTSELHDLNEVLLRDYKVLTALLRYTSPAAYTVEQRMLMLDFQYMQMKYSLTRHQFRRQARRSLEECARVLNHFANTMGERCSAVLRA